MYLFPLRLVDCRCFFVMSNIEVFYFVGLVAPISLQELSDWKLSQFPSLTLSLAVELPRQSVKYLAASLDTEGASGVNPHHHGAMLLPTPVWKGEGWVGQLPLPSSLSPNPEPVLRFGGLGGREGR